MCASREFHFRPRESNPKLRNCEPLIVPGLRTVWFQLVSAASRCSPSSRRAVVQTDARRKVLPKSSAHAVPSCRMVQLLIWARWTIQKSPGRIGNLNFPPILLGNILPASIWQQDVRVWPHQVHTISPTTRARLSIVAATKPVGWVQQQPSLNA